jgi:hypothetical protein
LPQTRRHQPAPLGRRQFAIEEVPGIRGDRRHRSLLLVERLGVIPLLWQPEAILDQAPDLVGAIAQFRRPLRIPIVRHDVGQPPVGREDVSLHLDQGDRSGDRAAIHIV